MLKTRSSPLTDRFSTAARSGAADPLPSWGPDVPRALPTLHGALVTLRELRLPDAPSLLSSISGDEVARFISPPPTSVEGFERFIAWADRQRADGHCLSFAVVPRGSETAIGLFQIRSLEGGFDTAEWGFALARECWGTGVFADGAALVVDFAVKFLGTHRLEARAALNNGRGNGALKKIGAVHEGVLRRSFLRHGDHLDQALWTILSEEWIQAKATWGAHIVH